MSRVGTGDAGGRSPGGAGAWLWLLPAEPDRADLRRIIADLSSEQGVPHFEPHVTLGDVRAADAQLVPMLARVACAIAPIEVVAGPTSHSDVWSRTLVAELDSPLIVELARRVHEAVGEAFDPSGFRPHLSLLYCRGLPEQTRDQLARRVSLAGRSLRFGALAAVRPHGPAEDVTNWRSIAEAPFGGTPPTPTSGPESGAAPSAS